jgi:hypothetical protein
VRRVYLEETSGQSRRKLYAHRVEASHEIGTRMVNDAQTEIAAFGSQNSGGPLNVTKTLAAIDSNISDIKKKKKKKEREGR